MFEVKLKFCQLYKFLKEHKEFIFIRDVPQTTCLCEICENVVFVTKVLIQNLKSLRQVLVNPHNIVEYYSCDSSSSFCMYSEYETCKYRGLSMDDCKKLDSNISIQERKRIKGKKTKDLKVVLMEDTIKLLNKHLESKRIQNAEFNRIKDNFHSNELLIQVDYV